jgi:hypothetical protein
LEVDKIKSFIGSKILKTIACPYRVGLFTASPRPALAGRACGLFDSIPHAGGSLYADEQAFFKKADLVNPKIKRL